MFTPESGVGPWPAVVLYMDAFGIRPELAGMAQRLASNGYVVALPNLLLPDAVRTVRAQRRCHGGSGARAIQGHDRLDQSRDGDA